MRAFAGVFAAVLVLCVLTPSSAIASSADLQRTFAGCVLAGGQVRDDGNEETCRLVRSWDFRIYYTKFA